LNYAKNSIFKFENGKANELFNKFYNNYHASDDSLDIILALKRAIPDYIELCIKKKETLYVHIGNSVGSRYRIAKYFIENLKADEMSHAIDFKKFLKIKRLPKDTKGIHGKFGTIKVSKIFFDNNIEDITNTVKSKVIPLKTPMVQDEFMNRFVYVREKTIEHVLIRKKMKPKKFDFILLI
jgi:hypothetical protein